MNPIANSKDNLPIERTVETSKQALTCFSKPKQMSVPLSLPKCSKLS